ncbi:hypothetical protein BT69DRAFT_1288626 [Atractiella rhizophila]|nr:hypothetical protein BT69DRAFT_1288626 [Atractiella rhizophila]
MVRNLLKMCACGLHARLDVFGPSHKAQVSTANAKPSVASATKKPTLDSTQPATKFRIRCLNYLYTLVLVAREAQQSPPGKSSLRVCGVGQWWRSLTRAPRRRNRWWG